MAADGKPSILEQLLSEAMERGAETARDEDFAVNLRNADGDEVTGIPISQAKGWLFDKFGIGEAPEAGGDGGTQGAGGKAGPGQGQSQNPVANLFRGGQAAKQQQRPASGQG
jgi:hypothetical protein